MPRDGAFIVLSAYGRNALDADFPPRPRRFRLEPGAFADYECSGPSYAIPFRDEGRAFQAQVVLRPREVDPRIRGQAVAILDSLEVM